MKKAMIKMVLFILAAMMLAGWMVSLLFFTAGVFIHILLMAAILLIMQAVIITPKPSSNRQ